MNHLDPAAFLRGKMERETNAPTGLKPAGPEMAGLTKDLDGAIARIAGAAIRLDTGMDRLAGAVPVPAAQKDNSPEPSPTNALSALRSYVTQLHTQADWLTRIANRMDEAV